MQPSPQQQQQSPSYTPPPPSGPQTKPYSPQYPQQPTSYDALVGIILGLIGGILLIIGTCSPWVTFLGVISFSGIGFPSVGWSIIISIFAYIILIMGILVIVGSLLGVNKMILSSGITALVLSIVTIIIIIVGINVAAAQAGAFGQAVGAMVGIGYGLPLCIVGSILAIVAAKMRTPPIASLFTRRRPYTPYQQPPQPPYQQS